MIASMELTIMNASRKAFLSHLADRHAAGAGTATQPERPLSVRVAAVSTYVLAVVGVAAWFGIN